MNKNHRSVWNARKQTYVAAAETVSARGKPCSGTQIAAVAGALFGGLLGLSAHAQNAPPPNTLPAGGRVSAGQAAISQSGAHMLIQQGSARAAINWQSFNVGQDAQVQFNQPGASSVTLNRVMSADPSQIFGRISANGQVVLTNPQGVYFGRSARVDVGGLVATTNSISDANFMAGNNRYERNGSTGAVVNEGELKAALGGYIALLAPEVRNQGAVIAQMGTVALAAGEAVDLHFDSHNRLTSIRVEPAQIKTLVDNRHAVQAPGGLIILSAQSMDRLLGGVVKNSGRIEADGMQQQGGRIVLSASTRVDNSGTIAANATTSANTSLSAAGNGPAGQVSLNAPEVINRGNISAGGAGGYAAGSVRIEGERFEQTAGASVRAEAPTQGGQIRIVASGAARVAGEISAAAQPVAAAPAPSNAPAVTAEPAAIASPVATASPTPPSPTIPTIPSVGGEIDIQAAHLTVDSARLDASGGTGGRLRLHASGVDTTVSSAPVTPAAPVPSDPREPGHLAVLGSSSLIVRGRGALGGLATLTGDDIALQDATRIDATGATGGGGVLVGGDWQGGASAQRRVFADPDALHQATTVRVGADVLIDASATRHGNGGTVVLWSDVTNAASVTTAQGSLFARGGLLGGNGGQIETSGRLLLTDGVRGSAAALQGRAGEWLFDPTNVIIGASGGANASNNGTNLSASAIAGLLDGGTSVTVTTSSGGSDLGDINVNAAIAKSTGSDVTLTLRAANSIVINQAISHSGGGKLNLTFDADNDTNAGTAATSPARDGAGIVILEADVSTGGGNLTFGGTVTTGFNGGDLYVGGGSSAITINTAGGNVDVKGGLIVANSSASGVTVATAGGRIDVGRQIDSGNRYEMVSGNRSWQDALNDADNVAGGYLATIKSPLENALAIRAAQYQQAWLGGRRIIGTNLWQWVAEPGYNATTNPQTFFYQGTASQSSLGGSSSGAGGTTATGYYANWNGWTNGSTTGEPNNSSGANFSANGESALQFAGTVGRWNDLPDNPSRTLDRYVREVALNNAGLTLNAGSGVVAIGGSVGSAKALASLNVNASSTTINGNALITSGAQTYSGSLTVNASDKLQISASSITTGGNVSLAAAGSDVLLDSSLTSTAGSASTLSIQANRHIRLGTNAPVSATGGGALNTELWADTGRDGDGLILIESSGIGTNGGALSFGRDGQTAILGGQTVRVGGDVFFQRTTGAQTLATAGGTVNVYGEAIVSNTAGLNVNSGNGDVNFHGLLDSGNGYTFVSQASGGSWDAARTAARNSTGGGGAVNDSYLATIGSRLENGIAGLTANYQGTWLGAWRPDTNSLNWTWADGPEAGQVFFAQTVGGGGSVAPGYYANFGSGEPNGALNSNRTGTESVGQFFGSAGLWNDLHHTTAYNAAAGSQYNVAGYVRETNLAASPVTINAGSGTVGLEGRVGGAKELADLTVTAGRVNLSAAVTTRGAQVYNAPVTLRNDVAVTTTNAAITFNGTVDSDSAGTPRQLSAFIRPDTQYYWVDWTSWNALTNTASGTITTPAGVVMVSYTNPQGIYGIQTNGGINYWTSTNAVSPYASKLVANGPSASDIIQLQYQGSQTLGFSESVENLAFSFVSLNGNGYSFNNDFDIASSAGSNVGGLGMAGDGYFGYGPVRKDVVGTQYQLNALNPNGIGGEPHGTIRFNRSFSTVSWQSQSPEVWNAFTVGIPTTSAAVGKLVFNGWVGQGAALGAVVITGGLDLNADIRNAASLSVTSVSDLGAGVTTSGDQAFTGSVTLSANSNLTTTANGSVTFGDTVNGGKSLTVVTQGTGDTAFAGTVGQSIALNGLSVTTDVITANAIQSSGPIQITNTGSSVIDGVIAGVTAALTKDGAGTLTLSGANTFGNSGNGITINGGVLQMGAAIVGNVTSSPLGRGPTVVNTGGSLDVAGRSLMTPLHLSGTGANGVGALLNSAATAVTVSGAITLAADASIKSEAGGALTLSGAVDGPHALTVDTDGTVADAAFALSGIVGGSTPLAGLTIQSGFADITVSAQTTVAGPIAISGGNIVLDAHLTALAGDVLVRGTGVTTLAAGAAVGAIDGDITVTGARFINNSGALSLSAAGTGKTWQVWSSNANPFGGATPDERGGLAFDFKQYSAIYGSSSVMGSGNGMFYSLSPTVTAAIVGGASTNKVYDGTLIATLPSNPFSASGAVDGDTGLVLSPGAANYAGKDVGSNIAVTATSVVVQSATSSMATGSKPVFGYSVAGGGTVTGNIGAITPKGLGATANASSKVYDGNTSASASLGLSGLVGSETLAVSNSARFNSKDVLSANTVTVDSVSLSDGSNGGLASNYSLDAGQTTAASITAKEIGLSASKTYDGSTDLSGAVTLSGLVGSETLAYTGAVASNQHVATSGKFVDAITLADGSNGGLASNYQLPALDAAHAAVTIAAATLTPTLINAAISKIYDGTTDAPADFVPQWSFSGLAAGDSAAQLGQSTAGFNSATVAGANTLTVSGMVVEGITGSNGSGASDYVLDTTSKTASASITPARLEVTANNDARFVTQSDAAGYAGVGYAGWVNGENPSVLGGTLAITRSNAGTNTAGLYAGVLQAAGLTADNYAVSYTAGDFTIVGANELLVRVADVSSGYGVATTYSVSSARFLASDNSTIVDLTGNVNAIGNRIAIDDTAGGSASFDLVPLAAQTAGSGALMVGNYQLGLSGAVTANSANFGDTVRVVGSHQVNAKGLSASATGGISKTYDGTTSMSGVSLGLSGLEAGDAVTVSGMGAMADRHAGTGKGYTISNLALAGGDATNYFLLSGSGFSGHNATITAKAVTLDPQSVARTYDGGTAYASSAADLSHLSALLAVAGDSVTGASLAFDNKNVGSGKTLTATAVTIDDGNSGNNYAVTLGSNSTSAITRLDSVTWIGGATGNWFDPGNWAGGAVPDHANVANVEIPQGVVVSFDTSGAVAPADGAAPVNLESLGSAGGLTQSNGSLNVGAGGILLASLSQTGGTLGNAGTTVVDSFSQGGGSFSGIGAMTAGQFSQTGGSTTLAGDLTVTHDFSQSGSASVAVGGNAQITDTSGGAQLGNLSTTGRLSVASTDGPIGQALNTVLSVVGPASFAASEGGNPAAIALGNAGNDFEGLVNLSGSQVTVRDANALTLGAATTSGDLTIQSNGALNLGTGTVGGNLSTDSGNRDISQSGPLAVNGATMLAAGTGNIALSHPGNDFGGTVNAAGSNIALADANALTLGNVTASGNLVATAATDLALNGAVNVASLDLQANTGGISQGTNSTLTVFNGPTNLDAAGNIALSNPGNDFNGAVNAAGADIALADAHALTLGNVTATGNLRLQSNGNLDLGTTAVGGTLNANSGNGNITQSGSLITAGLVTLQAGTGAVRLNNPGNRLPQGAVITAAGSSITGDAQTDSRTAVARVIGAVPVALMPGMNAFDPALPPPLMMAVADVPPRVDIATAAARTGNVQGVIVALADERSADGAALVAVSLPKGASAAGFGFVLPTSVRDLLTTGARAQASLADGSPLPAWLRFDAEALRFDASASPAGAIPIEVLLAVGDRHVRIVISERKG